MELHTTPAIVEVHHHPHHTTNGKQSGTLSPRSMPKVAPDGRGILRHLEDDVRKRALRIHRETGNPDGHSNWLAAERELHEEAMQRQAIRDRMQNAGFTVVDKVKKKAALESQLTFALFKKERLEKEQARLGEVLARLGESQKDVEDVQRKVDKEIEDLKNQIDDHDLLNDHNLDKNLQSPEEFSLRKNNSRLLEENKKPFRKINDFEDMKKLLHENVFIKGANLVIQDHEIMIKAAEH